MYSTVLMLDYNELESDILTFNECQSQSCTSLSIINDDKVEDIKFFTVHLQRTVGLDERISLSEANTTITIINDDGRSK